MRVLVVDDSNIIRRLIGRSLSMDEVEIQTAGNGLEALRLLRDFRPDLVTMDITMPEMDGLTCISRMVQADPKVRILVVTALADKSTAVEAVKRGAMGFLLKPFTVDRLNKQIAFVLED
jgi:two-component system, chemotaxis family, chemotaxis protein CheY